MPIYDFTCLECGREFTLVLSLSEHDQKQFVCPHCDSTAVERRVTTCEVITSKKS